MTDAVLPPDDAAPDMTAAELALGLLDGDERAAALRRVLGDQDFAREVERWRERLGPLAEAAPDIAPPPTLLARIEASIAAPLSASTGRGLWPAATALASLAAAILLVLLIARPTPPAPPAPRAAPAALLAASIQPSGTGAPIVALYDAGRATMRLGASPVSDPAHSAELWAIAGTAPPRPLGLMRGNASQLSMAPPARAVLTAGVTLAISREPAGGSPTGKPTGPVIATGVLQPV